MTAERPTTNGHVPDTELQRLEAAYTQLRARDGTAEWRAFQWKVLAFGLPLVTLAVGVWDHLDPRERVQGFVQVVQVTEQGQVVHVGAPQDLMAYEPKDAQWLDMVSEWVRKVKWRGSDVTAMKADWNWARAHLCGGPVTRLLDQYESVEKPFDHVGKKLVAVEVTHATRTPVPQTYHVLWNEYTSENRVEKVEKWVATFTVGRLTPGTQAVLLLNRLGLCISAFSLSPVHLGEGEANGLR